MRAHDLPQSTSDHDESFEPDVVYISTSEWLTIFERDVQECLGISAAEFVRRYRTGEYQEYDPVVTLLSTSIPFYEDVVTS